MGTRAHDPKRSLLTHPDPQALLDAYTGTGTGNRLPKGQPGFTEFFDTRGEIIGIYRDEDSGIEMPTTRGRIHYSKHGAHIVPAPPQSPKQKAE